KDLEDKVNFSKVYENVTKTGKVSSYGVDMSFPEMGLRKTVKSQDFNILPGKIEDTLEQWNKKYQAHLEKLRKEQRQQSAEQKTEQAQEALKELQNLLTHTLSVDDTVHWDRLKRTEKFSIVPNHLFEDGKAPAYIRFSNRGEPKEIQASQDPHAPAFEQVKREYGFLTRLFKGREIRADFQDRQIRRKGEREEQFGYAKRRFAELEAEFEEEKARENEALFATKERYEKGESEGVEEYCDLVLSHSQYPYYFPQDWILEYRPDTKMLLVSYQLPAPENLPQAESYKYIKARDQIEEKPLKQTEIDKLYESVIYQICIRTLHELFEADQIDALESVVFNGVVTNTNPATGQEETKTILSVSATKEEFERFDLSKVDPKATFKHLKGVSANKIAELAPVPPVASLDKTDKRIVEGRTVTADMETGANVAAMPWDDFEHLVREIFEKEFAESGGEVHITQASADGGIDGIVFDPDPLRGGKTVIQAKRYTRVVGISAVRDLYGAVINEGANKGILITTADYGKDSYEFAKDKPIQLINGGNLLSLLEKHGHSARIDLEEARNAN
ncbi:MAG TPA: restriction endonuclease, partial [Gammaproteobacteria bacterium]|nr:restriction endonuclease [Gammaproteobacteria bacterium]